MDNSQSYIEILIEFVVSLAVVIGVSVAFANTVKRRVKNREKFSGIGWGLLTGGIFGLGFIPVLIAQSAINRVVDQAKPKKYLEYARKQMKDFTKVYLTCFFVWIAIGFFPILGLIAGAIAIPIVLVICVDNKVEYPYNHDSSGSAKIADDNGDEMDNDDDDMPDNML